MSSGPVSFIAPVWLLGLLPWAAVTLWLLWGRRRRVHVPFLDLWKGPVELPEARRAIQLPPLALVAAIVAMLLAILAAAGPVIRSISSQQGPLISIVVDRGVTMSARGRTDLCFREAIDRAVPAIADALQAGPVDLLTVPGGPAERTDRSGWPSLARALPPTALDTRARVRSAVAQALINTTGPVVVLTDHAIEGDNGRVIQIAPEAAPLNVGIVHLAARGMPEPQIMVRLRNQSEQVRAILRVSSDGNELGQKQIDLPSFSQQRDYFVDVPELGRIITAEVLVDDQIPADNRASLVRQQRWPAIEPRVALPVELQRLIDRYRQLRPAGQESERVVVVNTLDVLPSDGPGIVLAGGASARPVAVTGVVTVAKHPITEALEQWGPVVSAGASSPSGPGWTPLVVSGEQVLVAARMDPVRQVWVNVPVEQWATRPEFVIFWTNAFDWLGEGGDMFVSSPIEPMSEGWVPLEGGQVPSGLPAGLWPGIYRRSDGTVRAVNALDVQVASLPVTDWRVKLARAAQSEMDHRQNRPLAGVALMMALTAMLISSMTWKRKRPRQLTPKGQLGQQELH